MLETQLVGALLGTAVGDALGLPYEGLAPERAARFLGPPDRQRLIAGRGMLSDDTEQTLLVLESWLAAPSDPGQFARIFARRLRWWTARLPPAIGKATLCAGLKLWCGWDPSSSGVRSAGNGAAMRSGILGVIVPELDALAMCVRLSSRVTHSDPRAEYGAQAVALAARWSCAYDAIEPHIFAAAARDFIRGADARELHTLIDAAAESARREEATTVFAARICGGGVSGYVNRTVPVALHAWFSHPSDYRQAIDVSIRAGGDTDTVAAIVGGLVGCRVGKAGIPAEWLRDVVDWPLSIAALESAATRAASAITGQTPFTTRPAWHALGHVARNLLLAGIVITHGLRRLFPPY